MRACPRVTMPAQVRDLKPRMGLGLCLRCPWSRSSPLFSYLEERCSAPGRTARTAGG